MRLSPSARLVLVGRRGSRCRRTSPRDASRGDQPAPRHRQLRAPRRWLWSRSSASGAQLSLASARLGRRPVVRLYLWHWPLIVFAGALWPASRLAAPLAAIVSVVPAWASFRYVENPLRFSPKLVDRRVVVLAAVCVAVPIAACGALLLATETLSRTDNVKSWHAGAALHADVVRGCDRSSPADAAALRRCTWFVAGSTGSAVLFGDSNAGQFTEPVARAANSAGLDFTVMTYSSCPPVGLRVERTAGELGACPGFSSQALQRLISSRPNLVVIAARTDKYLGDPSVGLGEVGGSMTHDPAAKAQLWLGALSALLRSSKPRECPSCSSIPFPRCHRCRNSAPCSASSSSAAARRLRVRSPMSGSHRRSGSNGQP